MKYPAEVVEAARVILDFIDKNPSEGTTLSLELLSAVEVKVNKGPTPADLQALWNDLRDPRLSECIKLNSRRHRTAAARLKEFPERDSWVNFIKVINKNSWLLGLTPSPGWPNWKADFDWFIKPTSIIKFMEGGFREENRYKSARDTYGEDLDARNKAAKETQKDD